MLHVSAFYHRAIIRLICEEMFSIQMWLRPIRDFTCLPYHLFVDEHLNHTVETGTSEEPLNISVNSVCTGKPDFYRHIPDMQQTSRRPHIIQCRPVGPHHHDCWNQHRHNLRINTSSKATHLTLKGRPGHSWEPTNQIMYTHNPDYHEYRERTPLINTPDE
jgi:hypothetical protein